MRAASPSSPRPSHVSAPLVFLFVGLVLIPLTQSPPPPPPPPPPFFSPGLPVQPSSVALALGSDGALTISLAAVDANGSALRYAMDGNFTALVDSFPMNDSARASLLQRIDALESTPIVSAYFGNRDGSVDASEVASFTALLEQGAQYLPSGSLTGGALFSVRLDGANASSARLTGVAFAGAVGSDSSTQPVTATSTLTDQFALGSGTHSLRLSVGVAIPAAPIVAISAVPLTFETPPAMAVTFVSGLNSGSTSNDAFGWGPSKTSGYLPAATNETVVIDFGPAFPLGDAVLAGGALAAIAAVGAVLWVRQRRRARAAAVPPIPVPGAPEAGSGGEPSGSG
jgi:hypothetical protein